MLLNVRRVLHDVRDDILPLYHNFKVNFDIDFCINFMRITH